MAAVLGKTEIRIKNTTTPTTIPDTPVAKLMYYLNSVCACVDADDDSGIHRLRDYKNYLRLSNEEEAKLLTLCLALSPDKLIGTVFFPNEDIDNFSNAFYELSAVSTKLVVAESLLIGGQQRRVHKIMMFKMSWIESYYLNPLRSYQNRRRAIRSPPQRQPSNNSSCVIL